MHSVFTYSFRVALIIAIEVSLKIDPPGRKDLASIHQSPPTSACYTKGNHTETNADMTMLRSIILRLRLFHVRFNGRLLVA